ncbi:MAG TPA: hypothetical protein VG753_01995, partial [Candidatus Paceibacterota bacterium]|nr:hypothetical protein [Candidatus Paceibacterota bacterium]
MAKEESDGVEGLKRRLYARGGAQPSPEDRTPLMQNEVHPPKSWSDASSDAPSSGMGTPPPPEPPQPAPSLMPRSPKRRMSLATKFFLGSVAFFVIATGAAAALFFNGFNTTSPQNIDVEVEMPSLIDGGKATSFEIIITNRNTTDLLLSDLSIDYPDGTRSAADPTVALTHDQVSIGTIKSGQQIKRTINALFYGQEGAQA